MKIYNKDIQTLFELSIFFVKYFAVYLFSVFLAVLAKLENSALQSLFYSISSFIFFFKVTK